MPYHIDEENSELAFEVREGNKLVIKIKSNIFSDSLELYLIKVGDNTEPTDKNVFSSLRVLKEIENLHDTILKEINSVTSGFWELKQDSQGNEYIATKYNVLTEGGLTTYGLGEQKLGTIYDGLPIDNDTIYWEEVEGSRVLKAKGSGGGSTGLDETKLWNVLGTPGDQQIDYSHLRSAFSQFSNEFVTINTEQEITALKHFTAGLSIGSAKKKIYEKDGVLYIDSNVAITGALTMYATDGQSVSSIYDGLPIDNDTIYWETVEGSRVLKAKGSGGEAGSVQWGNISGKPTWIEDTKPTYNWYEIQGEKPFYTKEEIASKYVTIDTEQEITALKHFTAGLSVGESKKKIYEENGVVYIDADVAVTGAMTFYATAGRTVSTIMDAVAVDGITIKKENNVLKAIAGAGSSFDENAMWSALSGSSDNQINKSHLTNALAGYATESWVASKNYATTEALNAVSNKLNDFLDGSDTDTIINKWKELEAFLSGMAETDNLAEILETKADKKYVDSTFVTLATKQTITGEKTFSSVLNTAAIKASGAITAPSLAVSDWVTIAGIKLRKLEDGALMLEGNLALTGGLTTYASDGVSFASIYDGLPIDNDTIYWQEVEGSKVLKAKEGSGSSFDKSAMWTALAGSTTEQINKSHLTTALTGYATESWVTSKNYLTSVSIATISDLHANWDALLKAAPSSYVTRWPTISEVTDRKNLIIKLNGGSTEGTNLFTYNVTGEKTINITPAGIGTYTKSESDSKYPTKTGSGASGTWGINITGNAVSSSKSNTIAIDGTSNLNSPNWTEYAATIQRFDASAGNRPPVGDNANAVLNIPMTKHGTSGMYGYQLAFVSNREEIYARKWSSGNPATWKRLPFVDYNTGYLRYGFSSVLSTDWFRSEGNTGWYSQTYGGGIYMTDSNYIRTLNNKAFCALRYDADQGSLGNSWNKGQGAFSVRIYNDGNQTPLLLAYRNATNDTGANRLFAMELLNNGNQLNFGMGGESQLELQKGYLIMNGTIRASNDVYGNRLIYKDITGTNLSAGDYFLSNQPAIKCEQDLAIVDNDRVRPILRWGDAVKNVGYNTRYVIGSVRSGYDWGRIFMAVSNNDAGTSTGCSFSIYGGGYVEIVGNLLVSGGATFYSSDIRYKSIMQKVELSLLSIANAPSFVYRWNRPNMNQNRLNLGGSAQYTQSVLPWAVEEKDNFLSMDYATVAYTFAVHTARHLLTYESRTDKKIKKLENRVKYLEKQLKKLGYEEVRTLGDQSV